MFGLFLKRSKLFLINIGFFALSRRFVCLMHDEMKIRADLVYDARSGEMVGFLNRENSGKQADEELATHVLCFYIVGLNSKLSMCVGFFPTHNANAGDVYSKLWNAIALLEKVCGLKVLNEINSNLIMYLCLIL